MKFPLGLVFLISGTIEADNAEQAKRQRKEFEEYLELKIRAAVSEVDAFSVKTIKRQ